MGKTKINSMKRDEKLLRVFAQSDVLRVAEGGDFGAVQCQPA